MVYGLAVPCSRIIDVLFANAKQRLVSGAVQITMKPNHLRSNLVRKHFGFDQWQDCLLTW